MVYSERPSLKGGRRAPTSTWCPPGTLRETIRLSLSARRSSKQRDYPPIRNASTRRKPTSEPHETTHITAPIR
ncbi:hypothetical protein K469DRAFT_793234 [Zopfia rhizophila CBS 207.26]|uniref:Uncharacterized protein n=1 Tax=Zopfia rhizophila CBS 207.26 TaxID=1314779 RepID=A0A6A6DPA7_9PEZI|nr:hypothetical protein K469DRAFT_793234 [Zopfia rhizophila CBS 207.26]